MIRGKVNGCPFGLGIPFGCSSAGGVLEDGTLAVAYMQKIDSEMSKEEISRVIEENLDVLFLAESIDRCPFADVIFKKKKAVDCKFNDEVQENMVGTSGLSGSPSYPHLMVGQMPKSQYGYGEPLEYMNNYTDDNNTNIYYGIYNLVG